MRKAIRKCKRVVPLRKPNTKPNSEPEVINVGGNQFHANCPIRIEPDASSPTISLSHGPSPLFLAVTKSLIAKAQIENNHVGSLDPLGNRSSFD